MPHLFMLNWVWSILGQTTPPPPKKKIQCDVSLGTYILYITIKGLSHIITVARTASKNCYLSHDLPHRTSPGIDLRSPFRLLKGSIHFPSYNKTVLCPSNFLTLFHIFFTTFGFYSLYTYILNSLISNRCSVMYYVFQTNLQVQCGVGTIWGPTGICHGEWGW